LRLLPAKELNFTRHPFSSPCAGGDMATFADELDIHDRSDPFAVSE